MANLRYFLKKAQKEKWAIGQFNFSTFEVLKGIVFKAKEMSAPVILGTSEKEVAFLGLRETVSLVKILRKIWRPIFLNLDHGTSFESVKQAIEVGYDGVHFDGSSLSFKENIRVTKEIVKYARKKGVLVEGEVGKIPKVGEKGSLTDPEEALEFFEKTKVESLAISVGNVQGIFPFEKKPRLNFERIKEIKEKLKGKAFLVLHGGSGIEDREIKRAIKMGITKININTELRFAFTQALRKFLFKNQKEIIPYKYLIEAIQKVKERVERKILLFGSQNKA